MMKSKDLDLDFALDFDLYLDPRLSTPTHGYMVDSLPRDSLSEGRGQRLEQGLQPRLHAQRLRLHGRQPPAQFPV